MRMPRFDVHVLVDGIETMRRITQQGRDYYNSCSYIPWTVVVGNKVYTCCIVTKGFARAAIVHDEAREMVNRILESNSRLSWESHEDSKFGFHLHSHDPSWIRVLAVPDHPFFRF